MTPAASVSGLYLAHPEARYFTVGRIGRDQVEDYARRKGMTVDGGRALALEQLAMLYYVAWLSYICSHDGL